MTRKFIAVDLDGTLAYYDGWRGPGWIGEPIPAMVARVKNWLAEGHVVVVHTSRVAPPTTRYSDDTARELIQDWCQEHLGQRLEVTCIKERYFSEYWDDRAVAVETNTGRIRSDRPV